MVNGRANCAVLPVRMDRRPSGHGRSPDRRGVHAIGSPETAERREGELTIPERWCALWLLVMRAFEDVTGRVEHQQSARKRQRRESPPSTGRSIDTSVQVPASCRVVGAVCSCASRGDSTINTSAIAVPI